MLAVDPVAVTQQEPWRTVLRESLDDLLGGPFGSGVGRDVEVKHASLAVGEDEEDEEDLVTHGRDDEEVDGNDVPDVVLEEGGYVAGGVFRWRTR